MNGDMIFCVWAAKVTGKNERKNCFMIVGLQIIYRGLAMAKKQHQKNTSFYFEHIKKRISL
jgi:hypothetical protein